MGLHDKKPHHGEAFSKMGSVDSLTIHSLHSHITLDTLLGINFDRTRGKHAMRNPILCVERYLLKSGSVKSLSSKPFLTMEVSGTSARRNRANSTRSYGLLNWKEPFTRYLC